MQGSNAVPLATKAKDVSEKKDKHNYMLASNIQDCHVTVGLATVMSYQGLRYQAHCGVGFTDL